jgi:16S rRNA (uracil1498-N3)-methyltransferase
MARRRFFVDEVRDSGAALCGEDARHLRQVLRAEAGQRYELCDNRKVYLAEIAVVEKDLVSFRILEELPASEPPLRLTLMLSLIKFDRFEWALEKATELGVAAVVPVEAARSEKGLRAASAKRLERWRKIAVESSQQSRRARLPEVQPAVAFEEALARAAAGRLFLEEKTGARPVLDALPPDASGGIALLVGPEGGWTDAERARAAEAGWTPVSLGPTILRAETAAIAGLAVLLCAAAS